GRRYRASAFPSDVLRILIRSGLEEISLGPVSIRSGKLQSSAKAPHYFNLKPSVLLIVAVARSYVIRRESNLRRIQVVKNNIAAPECIGSGNRCVVARRNIWVDEPGDI